MKIFFIYYNDEILRQELPMKFFLYDILSGIKTRAARDGDDLIINGGKMWTTNGSQADWMCCLVNTSDGKPHANKSLVCLPMDSPGEGRILTQACP